MNLFGVFVIIGSIAISYGLPIENQQNVRRPQIFISKYIQNKATASFIFALLKNLQCKYHNKTRLKFSAS